MSGNEPRYPEIKVQLSGEDGNAFFMAARTRTALKRGGVSEADQTVFFEEALSGDYYHVLQTIMEWVSTT